MPEVVGSEEVQLAVHVVENRFGRGGVQKVEKQEATASPHVSLGPLGALLTPFLVGRAHLK